MLPSLLSSVTRRTLPVLEASMIASLSNGYTVRKSRMCAEMPSCANFSAA